MKIAYKLIRKMFFIYQRIRIISYKCFHYAVKINGKAIYKQPLLITGNGTVSFKGKVQIGYFPSAYFFSGYSHFDLRDEHSHITINDETSINNNSVIVADDGTSIDIGKKCLIGTNFYAVTSDFHSLLPSKRHSGEYSRTNMIISDNVFIGNNVSILKGITIGKNSVIGAGSTVISDIPENVIASGVPCKILRDL